MESKRTQRLAGAVYFGIAGVLFMAGLMLIEQLGGVPFSWFPATCASSFWELAPVLAGLVIGSVIGASISPALWSASHIAVPIGVGLLFWAGLAAAAGIVGPCPEQAHWGQRIASGMQALRATWYFVPGAMAFSFFSCWLGKRMTRHMDRALGVDQ